MQEKLLDVAIIGGGWSGIIACKWMVQNGLKTLAFEATDDIGGVFKYREDATNVGGVMRSTHLTSSKTTTEMSDYPMPASFPQFPSHAQVMQYLNDYIDHFHIRDHFLLKTKIVEAKKEGNIWILEDHKGHKYKSKNLVVCCGVHQNPDMYFLEDEKFKEADVKMIHAAAYKVLTKEYYDKKILVYGGGETASDICSELCPFAKQVILSIPHGQWFVNRYWRTSDHLDNPLVLDQFSSRLRRAVDPVDKAYAGLFGIERDGGVCGHGIKEWESSAPYRGQFLNKSAHIIPHFIMLGSLVPKPEVTKIVGKEVVFTDGTKETIDMAIFCVGYKTTFPLLKEEKYKKPINERFKFLFDQDDPSLAFVGFARPVVGSIPAIAEMQSIYAAKVFSKKLELPTKRQREKIIERDINRQMKQFSKTSQRIKGLVTFEVYTDEIAEACGMYPNYTKLFFKSPKKWLLAITAPYNSSVYHLADETQHERIFATLKSHLHPFLIDFRYMYIQFAVVSLFPSFFLIQKKSKIATLIKRAYDYLISTILWILLLPVIVFRIFKYKRGLQKL